jgi:hypothetical protein
MNHQDGGLGTPAFRIFRKAGFASVSKVESHTCRAMLLLHTTGLLAV